jgi:hypothetical protein
LQDRVVLPFEPAPCELVSLLQRFLIDLVMLKDWEPILTLPITRNVMKSLISYRDTPLDRHVHRASTAFGKASAVASGVGGV